MEFSLNSPILFIIVGAILLLVLAQSVFFLIRAWKAGKEMGMETSKLRKTVVSSAIFTIAPAISILMGVLVLSKKLGLALPWLRLSVIGALTYELTAAENAAKAAGTSLSDSATVVSGEQFLNITIVMTIGIIVGLILVPILCKKIQGGMVKMRDKDTKWGELVTTALFMGMISAFMGLIFGNINTGLAGWIPVFVMIVSAVCMALFGLLIKVTKWNWINDYALPICMLVGMASALPITNWIGG
ncbi:MAG: DUF5058 family protein [Clostridia bacterium]|nr:DUF5058 family protein [Clostridia bacterium]